MQTKIMNFNKILFGKHVGHRYNRDMDKTTIDNQKVQPDQKTGKKPTTKQLELLYVLNPFRRKNKVTYAVAAVLLGISISCVGKRMSNFKRSCPVLHANFDKVRYPDKYREKRVVHKTGCIDCGTDVPVNQRLCFRCWKIRDKKYNPNDYNQDTMFPANGKTKSTILWDKWADNDYYHSPNEQRSSSRASRRGY